MKYMDVPYALVAIWRCINHCQIIKLQKMHLCTQGICLECFAPWHQVLYLFSCIQGPVQDHVYDIDCKIIYNTLVI